MAAGVTGTLHDLDWFLDMIEEAWPQPVRPKTYKKRVRHEPEIGQSS